MIRLIRSIKARHHRDSALLWFLSDFSNLDIYIYGSGYRSDTCHFDSLLVIKLSPTELKFGPTRLSF